MMIFRTAVLALFLALVLVCVIPILLPVVLFDLKGVVNGIAKVVLRISRVILDLRLEIEGNGEETGADPCLFMSNHLSLLDGPLLFLLIRRPVRIIVKKSLFGIPVIGLGMRLIGYVPVDRKGANRGREAIYRAAGMMKRQGCSFLIFPEGTRSLSGELGPFRRGGFFLAREAGAPIVPISIRGSFEMMPKGRLVPRQGRLRVVFHPPIPVPEGAGEDLSAWMRAVRERIASVPA
jgi:1-acyl-sn-glycerol-3-phosphate acyltransferase